MFTTLTKAEVHNHLLGDSVIKSYVWSNGAQSKAKPNNP
jgi:hypothetical protein